MNAKKYFYIKGKEVMFPVNSTITYSFLLYYFQINGLFLGIFITFYSIYWIGCIYAMSIQKPLIIEEDEHGFKLIEKK